MYSRSRITDGAGMDVFAERTRCPLCSSMRATPLNIITTARRSVQTFIGSKEAFKTNTLPVILNKDIKRTEDFVTSKKQAVTYEILFLWNALRELSK